MFFEFCPILPFLHYLILNLCDNVFIFIICTKYSFVIKKYFYFNDSVFLFYMKSFIFMFYTSFDC